MNKKNKRTALAVFTCIVAMLCMAGCAKKDSEKLTEKNSFLEKTSLYSYRIPDTYKDASDDKDYTDTRLYINEHNTMISVEQMDEIYCSPEVAFDYFTKTAVEESNATISKKQLDDKTSCCMMTRELSEGKHGGLIIVACNRNLLLISILADSSVDVESVKSDMELISDSVKFTGAYSRPSDADYPYYVQNSKLKVEIQKNLYATILGGFEESVDVYSTALDSEIEVHVCDGNNFNDTFAVIMLDRVVYKTDIDEYVAKCMHEYDNAALVDASCTEMKLCDVWPEIADEMKDTTVFDLEFVLDSKNEAVGKQTIHKYVFEYQDYVYWVKIVYFEDVSKDTVDSLYQVMYNVEYL